jgi:ribosomal-protein-serine acetyltransferase
MTTIKIDTNIELRQIRTDDAPEFINLINKNRSYLREWLGWLDVTKTAVDLLRFITFTLKEIDSKKALCCLIWQKEQIVGIVHLREIDLVNKKAMIGYWVGEEFRGQGLARIATQAITSHGFREIKLNKIEIRCATGNKASQAIPKKLGFKEEAVLRENEWLYDHFVDHVVFSALAGEWKL